MRLVDPFEYFQYSIHLYVGDMSFWGHDSAAEHAVSQNRYIQVIIILEEGNWYGERRGKTNKNWSFSITFYGLNDS
jgi:hypothetical protein